MGALVDIRDLEVRLLAAVPTLRTDRTGPLALVET